MILSIEDFIFSVGGERSKVLPKEERKPAIGKKQIELIQEIAENISYGTITLVFQNGVLVQIDRNEKIRIPSEQKITNHKYGFHDKKEK